MRPEIVFQDLLLDEKLYVNLDDILVDVRPALEEAAAFINGEAKGTYTTQFCEEANGATPLTPLPRDLSKGWVNRLWDMHQALRLNTAGVVLQQPYVDAESEESYVKDLLGKYFDVNAYGGVLSYLPTAVLSTVEGVRSLSGFRDRVIAPLVARTENPSYEFELMKLIAQPIPELKHSPRDRELEALQLLYFFNPLNEESEASLPAVDTKLEDGEFDTLIARDILFEASYQTEHLDQDDPTELQRMLLLAARMTGQVQPTDDIITMLTDKGSLSLWPQECKKVLNLCRSQYALALREARSHAASIVSDGNCAVRKNTEADVQTAADNLTLELATKRSQSGGLSMTERLEARSVARKVRRERRATLATVGSVATSATQEVKTIEPRTVAYIKPDGTMASEDSSEYKENVLEGYLNKHRDQPNLEKDLRAAIDYLRTADFSAGLPRGIFKLRGGINIQRGELCIPKIYELKPYVTIGLTMQSEQGHKLRILFALIKDTVGILGVDDRDQAAARQRSIGMHVNPGIR
jgi:hypothetical protein